MTCPNCDCPLDDDEERTYIRCPFCGHISYNPGSQDDDVFFDAADSRGAGE